MHAVVVRVTIMDLEGSEPVLREQVVPRVSEAPGSSPATGPARTMGASR